MGAADWAAIAAIKKHVSIPVVACGGVETRDDVARCLAATGADAVMSAEALLGNPALFSARPAPPDALVAQYLDLAERHPPKDFHVFQKQHVLRMLHGGLGAAARDAVSGAADPAALRAAVGEACGGGGSGTPWYRRHRGGGPDEEVAAAARKVARREKYRALGYDVE